MASKEIKKTIAEQDEFPILLDAAKKKVLNSESEAELLNAIRNGDFNSIVQLVESSEMIILSVIRNLNPNELSLQEMFDSGKAALMKLAGNEINSEGRERYFRFSAWVVKQAILSLQSRKSEVR